MEESPGQHLLCADWVKWQLNLNFEENTKKRNAGSCSLTYFHFTQFQTNKMHDINARLLKDKNRWSHTTKIAGTLHRIHK
jgi:hypothetical protein